MARLKQLIAVDPRSLAAFRIGLGGLLLADLAGRLPELRAHLTDAGVLPRAEALAWLDGAGALSVHLLDGSLAWTAVLFCLAAAAAVAMLVGWRTRWATLASFYLLLSLHLRNVAVLTGGDNLLRLLLFWALFLPLGERWSLDARRRRAVADRPIASMGTAAVLIQVTSLYWFTVAAKWNADWLSGVAVPAALAYDVMATPWGAFLAGLPALEAATWAVLALEVVGSIVVWSPWQTARWRAAAVAGFAVFHLLGLAPALRLGIFPWVSAVSWLVFVPAAVWDRGASQSPSVVPAPSPGPRRAPRTLLRDALAAVALAAVLLSGLDAARPERLGRLLPEAVAGPMLQLGFRQGWEMFARPPRADDWWLFAGRLADGAVVDAWSGGAVSGVRPVPLALAWGDERWTKYLAQLREREFVFHRRLFGNFLCRRWRERHPEDPLASLTFLYFRETERPGDVAVAPQAQVLFAMDCPGSAGSGR